MDASYLSPNVNMAARLESATKQYGVDILMSADFSALLSPRMRARCRQIDTVLVKGSAEPMGIWTIDTDTRFVVSDGLEVHAGNHAFVHSSRTDFAWVEAGLDEFEGHTDVQLSYAANSDFLLVWQVRAGRLCSAKMKAAVHVFKYLKSHNDGVWECKACR